MNPYLQKIKNFAEHLSDEVRESIERTYSHKKYTKGEFLLKPGQVCDGHFMIDKGIARMYSLHDGKEITTAIYFEGGVAISFDSYILQKSSQVYIEALTDLEDTKVGYRQFQIEKQKHPELIELEKLFVEIHAANFEKQVQEERTLNATERYLKLLKQEPQIIQFIPLTIVASYLNISLETLSRIRAKIVQKH